MNLLDIISKNRKFLLVLIIFCIFPAFVLADDILGNFLGGLASVGGMALDIAKGIIGAALAVLAGLAVQLLSLGLDFLQWTSSGDFIQKGMTSSMDNPMISEGWSTVRNIANILLVFGLVAVAISIMLEYQETKAKKMLINFVLMALLINFTPVICDTIIDVANSLMRVFLKGGVSPDLATELKNQMDSGKLENIVTNIVLTGFCILSFFVYLLYGILFMFRYVQLWLLIIISPIAFASKVFLPTEAARYMSYILPDQCQWEAWWKDFLNWAFIGVPAAFTIFLSNRLMTIIHENASSIVAAPGGSLQGTFSMIICYMLPLGVLIQGFIMTMNKGNTAVFNMGSKLQGTFNRVANPRKIATAGINAGKWAGRGAGGVATRIATAGQAYREGGIGGAAKHVATGFGNKGRQDFQKWNIKTQESLGLKERGTYESMVSKKADEKFNAINKLSSEERKKIENPSTISEKVRARVEGVMGTRKDTLAAIARSKATQKETSIDEYVKTLSDSSEYDKTDPKVMETLINNLISDTKEGKVTDEHFKKLFENEDNRKTIQKYDKDNTVMKNAAKIRPELAPILLPGKDGNPATIKSVTQKMNAQQAGETIDVNSIGNVEVFNNLSAKHLEGIAKYGSEEKILKAQEMILNHIQPQINSLNTKLEENQKNIDKTLNLKIEAENNGKKAETQQLEQELITLNTEKKQLLAELKPLVMKADAIIKSL